LDLSHRPSRNAKSPLSGTASSQDRGHDRTLSVVDAAEHLGISKSSVYNLIAQGAFSPIANIGTAKRPRIRIPAEAVEKFIASRTEGHWCDSGQYSSRRS